MILSEKALRASLAWGSGLVSLILWALALNAYIQIYPLTKRVLAHVEKWQVEQMHSEHFRLRAIYSFKEGSRVFKGDTLLLGVYRNEMSAIRGLQRLAKEPQTAWFDPLNPRQSSLEKHFTWNLFARAMLSTLVSFYFIYIYFKRRFNLEYLIKKEHN